MGKQKGKTMITGTKDNVNFYKFRNGYYMRKKSSLTAKRVKTDPAFRKTMENAAVFGIASRISTEVYRNLPPEKKKNRVDLAITSHAVKLLRVSGLEPEKVREVLMKEYVK